MKIKKDEIQLFETYISQTEKLEIVKNKKQKYELQMCADNNKSIYRTLQKQSQEDNFNYGRLMADFGLKLIIVGVNQDLFDNIVDLDLKQQTNSLMELVVECLSSTNNNLISSSLLLLIKLLNQNVDLELKDRIIDNLLVVL